MRQIILTVTEEHIKNGEPHSSRSCAAALALRGAGYRSPVIGSNGVNPIFYPLGDTTMYLGDDNLNKFVLDFDSGKKVEPGVFTLTEK